jgi:hypothetical protein
MTKDEAIKTMSEIGTLDNHNVSMHLYCGTYAIEIEPKSVSQSTMYIPIHVCEVCSMRYHGITIQCMGDGKNTMRAIIM